MMTKIYGNFHSTACTLHLTSAFSFTLSPAIQYFHTERIKSKDLDMYLGKRWKQQEQQDRI